MSTSQVKEAVEYIENIFKDVAPLILEHAGSVEFTDKHDGSPVTDTDVEVENIILAKISERFPQTPIFGEEGGYKDVLPPQCWLIDPIDGTSSFIKNSGTFTSMAVLIQDEEAVAAVIYNPTTEAMYTAHKDRGAFRNGERLDLAKMSMPKRALCKGRHVQPLNTLLQARAIRNEIAPEGGGHGFTMVADGRVAARFQMLSRGGIHDYAPGALLVNEAGGDIIPIKDTQYTYRTKSFVACHPELSDAIRTNISDIRALETPS